MKLIYADTVATRIEEMPCYYDECIDTIEAIVEMIKYDIPPVEAIPIEWLNKRVEEIVFAYWTNARNKMTLPLNELPLLIDQIIGEWEKENANNNQR